MQVYHNPSNLWRPKSVIRSWDLFTVASNIFASYSETKMQLCAEFQRSVLYLKVGNNENELKPIYV